MFSSILLYNLSTLLNRFSKKSIDKYLTGEIIDVKDALDSKQPTINDGDLTIAKTLNLQTVLDDKQDEITTDTDVTLNSITSQILTVSVVALISLFLHQRRVYMKI